MTMIEYAFVMVISTNPIKDDFKYIGNFQNCLQAELYVSLHHPDKRASRCLMKDYIHLPEGTVIKNIDMANNTIRYKNVINSCKLRRDCR